MITAHRCAKCPDPKYDLVSKREGNIVEDVTADKGSQDVGDGEHDVARACNVCTEPVWHGFGEECVEANTKWREGDRHEERDEDDSDDLTVVVKEPGEKDKEEKAGAVENG